MSLSCILLALSAALAQVGAKPDESLSALARQVSEGDTLELAAGEYRLAASMPLGRIGKVDLVYSFTTQLRIYRRPGRAPGPGA
ncbi:MAG: hypothetical protein C4333_09100 [Meiothermus sp.]